MLKCRSDFEENECVPDISTLSHLVKPCLQEDEPLPQDHKSLLCDDLFGMHNDHVPDVADLYQKLNVNCRPLTLVEPEFVCPHPPLRLATHQPCMADCPHPALELFDLDECFSDVRGRLAHITNHFSDDTNLDNFIKEASCILGLDVGMNADLSKRLLYRMSTQVRCYQANIADDSKNYFAKQTHVNILSHHIP